MATREIVRDMPQKQLAPIDPDVQIPPAVKAAAEKANSYYKKAVPAQPVETPPVSTPADDPPVVSGNTPPDQPVSAEVAPPAEKPKRLVGRPRNPVPAPEPPPPPVEDPPPHQVPQAAAPPAQPDNWEHRYHSMKGRHDALLQAQGSMQEQMSQMGDELMRMQQILQQRGAQVPTVQTPATKKLVTDEDVKTYGPELIDLARRAGREAVEPELEASHTEIRQLKQKLALNAQAGVQQTLTSRYLNGGRLTSIRGSNSGFVYQIFTLVVYECRC